MEMPCEVWDDDLRDDEDEDGCDVLLSFCCGYEWDDETEERIDDD